MSYISDTYDTELCKTRIAAFKNGDGTEEQHIMLTAVPEGSFASQLTAIHETRDRIISGYSTGNQSVSIVFQRYFISDATNQSPIIRESFAGKHPPTSVIQQPPLDGSKVALWIYLHKEIVYPDTGIGKNGYQHFWTANIYQDNGPVYQQSEKILEEYKHYLISQDCTLKDNCIRTWFFVRDVDTNYGDFVKARKDFFDKNGLIPQTHYIASTGIEGRNDFLPSQVTMDAYAVKGITQQQVTYLHALSHLSPTNIYGVTFERGVAVQFGDRKHIYISGTASIDHLGHVVHIGDVEAQTFRMCENIEALLKEAGATLSDIVQGIVYLRDTADYRIVKKIMDNLFPEIPLIITLAPVCRPSWLVEMECIAITAQENKRFRDF